MYFSLLTNGYRVDSTHKPSSHFKGTPEADSLTTNKTQGLMGSWASGDVRRMRRALEGGDDSRRNEYHRDSGRDTRYSNEYGRQNGRSSRRYEGYETD